MYCYSPWTTWRLPETAVAGTAPQEERHKSEHKKWKLHFYNKKKNHFITVKTTQDPNHKQAPWPKKQKKNNKQLLFHSFLLFFFKRFFLFQSNWSVCTVMIMMLLLITHSLLQSPQSSTHYSPGSVQDLGGHVEKLNRKLQELILVLKVFAKQNLADDAGSGIVEEQMWIHGPTWQQTDKKHNYIIYIYIYNSYTFKSIKI